MSRINDELHARIVEKIAQTVAKINNHYGMNMPIPPVYYDLKGTTAGIARYHHDGRGKETMSVHLQPKLFVENLEDSLDNTVPHEVCHLGVLHKSRLEKRKVFPKPHGAEWKLMMWVVGAAAKNKHDYDVEDIRKKKTEYQYQCGCDKGQIVSATIHKRIKDGRRYQCKKCHVILHSGERILKLAFSRPSPNGTTRHNDEEIIE
jgi:SprT protein